MLRHRVGLHCASKEKHKERIVETCDAQHQQADKLVQLKSFPLSHCKQHGLTFLQWASSSPQLLEQVRAEVVPLTAALLHHPCLQDKDKHSASTAGVTRVA